MVVVGLAAGLANRMFQYALGCELHRRGYDVYFDKDSFEPEYKHESIDLQYVFPEINIKYSPKNLFKRAYKKDFISRIYRRISMFFPDNRYILERPLNRHKTLNLSVFNHITKNCMMYGLWQSEKYFEHSKEEIRRNFRFRAFEDDRNIATAQQMQTENSIAIHIRKGKDYQSMRVFDNTCSAEYYLEAINYIQQHIPNPVFYVFTDNPQWVRNNLKNINYILVDWNPTSGKNNFRDMQLMTYAKHNIIANSTYSWWGAWLNNNPNKIVIAPQIWFNPSVQKAPYIIPSEWIKL